MDELFRITKTNGRLAGSININEPPTAVEPQTIAESDFEKLIGSRLIMEGLLKAPKHAGEGGTYKYLNEHCENQAESCRSSRSQDQDPAA